MSTGYIKSTDISISNKYKIPMSRNLLITTGNWTLGWRNPSLASFGRHRDCRRKYKR